MGVPALTQTAIGETYNGLATIRFDIEEGSRAFLVTLQAEPNLLVYDLIDPDGTVVYSYNEIWAVSPYELPSSITLPAAGEVQINWPLGPDDAAPAPGEWSARLFVLDSGYNPMNFARVDATVYQTSAEADEGLCLSAQVILTEGISEDAELMAAIEDALQRWSALYADIGLTLSVSIEDTNLASTIPQPVTGSADYAELDSQVAPEVITVIIGESFAGSADGVLGQTGGLPGAMLSTERAAVAVSWLMNAGIDGTLSDNETQMLSETLAHEVAHYLGLMHPVQYDENANPVAFDALSDTPKCSDYYDCEADLGDNLMYPYAGCWWDSSCDPQSDLTDDQSRVMRRYAGVR